MSTITAAQAQAKLDAAMAAYDKALESSSYSVSDGEMSRSQSRQSLAELQQAVQYWEKRVSRLTRGGVRVVGATPVT